MTKESYSQRQQILMRRLIKLHTKPVYVALQSQMRRAADAVRSGGFNAVHSLSPVNTEIANAVINLYQDAAILAKKKYMSTKRFGGSDNFINKVLSYLKQHLLDKVVTPISNTTKDVIASTIKKAIAQGWGVEKTAKFLETAPITKARARMIVRTESVRATNYSQMLAADDEVYQMEKTWIAIEDNRTRASHSHRGVDGETQDLDKLFTNGLLFPGDPTADAEEVVNCRCTMGYKVKRTPDGKPQKKVISPIS